MGGYEMDWIVGFATVLVALATYLVARVARIALIKESDDRMALRERAELREVVGDLIASIEVLRSQINSHNVVSIDTTPYLHNEFAKTEASIGTARAHGLPNLVEKATIYVKAVRKYRLAVIRLKRKREKVLADSPLPKEYKDERDRVSSVFREMEAARDGFLDEASIVLDVTVSKASSFVPEEDEGN